MLRAMIFVLIGVAAAGTIAATAAVAGTVTASRALNRVVLTTPPMADQGLRVQPIRLEAFKVGTVKL